MVLLRCSLLLVSALGAPLLRTSNLATGSSVHTAENAAASAAAALGFTLQELKQHLNASDLQALSDSAEKLYGESGSASVHLKELQEELSDLEALQQEAGEASTEDQASLRGKIQEVKAEAAAEEAAEQMQGAQNPARNAEIRAELDEIEQRVACMEAQASRGEGGVTEEELAALRLRLAELRHELEQREGSMARPDAVCGRPGGSNGEPYSQSSVTTRAGSNGEPYYTRQTSIAYSRSSGAPGAGPLDIDSTAVPYPGSAGPFGREGTAQQLTDSSVQNGDEMVERIEAAQSMEAKRAVYRALTRLRGLTISAYDGVARGHMANVDEYARTHHWRSEHKVRHLAEEEANIDEWAFPVDSYHVTAGVVAVEDPTGTLPAAAPGPAPALAFHVVQMAD